MDNVKLVTRDLLNLVSLKTGFDIDKQWGFQCADLTNGVTTIFFGKSLAGNAIDLLNSAKKQGFKVIYEAIGVYPKEGWLFVMNMIVDGVNYGHTGYVYKDSDGYTLDTIEQNIDGYSDNNRDGINDQLQVGGVARINRRNFDGIVGYIVPDYSKIKTAKVIESGVKLNIEKRIRGGLPQVGVTPYRQIHAHSTGNPNSTAQNEADYMMNKDINTGFYTHVVGNGRIIQVANTNRGGWDVGGNWNMEGYASVELIESHKNKNEFMVDYKLYINLLRQLAKEAGIPTTLDNGSTGIISHAYATAHQPNNFSDHVDPYPYLAKWGISKAQFASDLSKGFSQVNVAKAKAKPTVKQVYQANDVKFVHGIYQIKCDYLVPTQFTWTENGIPVAMVNWVDKNGKNLTDGKDKDFKKGMYFTFAGDEAHITDTGEGGENYGYYWRKFIFGEFGEVWLSAYDKNHLVNK